VVGWGQGAVPSIPVSAIAGSEASFCATQADTGAVVCWGDDSLGQASPPPSVNGTVGTASAIAAGGLHSCAIQAGSGAVVCWGSDDYGQATPPPSVDGTAGTATAIAAGGQHSLAIRDVPICADGVDNDGDGAADYPADPGCRDATSTVEDPRCQDGLDNDSQPGIDFDGGASVNGGIPIAAPDPQCTTAWKKKEAAATCGLGAELALVLPLIAVAYRRSRRLA
jgi:hypothetical protein